ncbi:hypothetical protein ACTQ3U_02240 [Oscillospiraceae bacterium LCP25S3_F9]
MEDNKNTSHFCEDIVTDAKLVAKDEIKDIVSLLIKVFSQKIKDKIPELPDKIEMKIKEMTDKPEIVDEIVAEWSQELYKKGLVPKGYSGLTDELLIANFHQDGYLDGLYAGYVLAMMSLVDNKADEELILSVRDDIRPNLIGHHYNDRGEFYEKYKNETYSWIESTDKEMNENE